MMKRFLVLLVAFVAAFEAPFPVSAQTSPSEPVASTELRSEVRRDINRYRWVFGGRTEQRVGAWRIAADSRFTSDALALFDNQLSFRDEYSLSATGSMPLGRATSLRVSTDADWYSLSRVFSGQTYAGPRSKPHLRAGYNHARGSRLIADRARTLQPASRRCAPT